MNEIKRETFVKEIEFDDETGHVLSKVWRNSNGEISNPDAAAVTEYDADGRIIQQKWMFNGHLGRSDDKPAIIQFDWEASIRREEYWNVGRLHRSQGPAIINYSMKTGEVLFKAFFDRGKSYTP